MSVEESDKAADGCGEKGWGEMIYGLVFRNHSKGVITLCIRCGESVWPVSVAIDRKIT